MANPLDVLSNIIGKKTADRHTDAVTERPAELVEDINFGDLSLEEFMTRGQKSGGLLSSEAGTGTIEQCLYHLGTAGKAVADQSVVAGDRHKFQELHNAIAVSSSLHLRVEEWC